MSNEMSDEDFQKIANQKLTNTAVEIAKQVTIYVHRESQRKVNHGAMNPFLLEDMTLAYASALAKFSLYKSLPEDKRPSWEQMQMDAIEALTVAFSHIQAEIEKEGKVCQIITH